MAIAHDINTRFPITDTTGLDTTTGDRTFTHTPTGTPKGAIVVLAVGANVDGVTGVLYGGIVMRKQVTALDTIETGRVTIWTLAGETVPTGTQTVTLQGCTADNKWCTCSTVTATTDGTKVNAFNNTDTTTSTNPTVTVVTTAETLLYGAVAGGAAAPTSYVSGTGYTTQHSADYGAKSARSQRRTSPVAAGSIVFNFTFGTSDDWCIGAVALEEFTLPTTISLVMAQRHAV